MESPAAAQHIGPPGALTKESSMLVLEEESSGMQIMS